MADAILDPHMLGELLKTARSYAGFPSAEAAEEAMPGEVGISMAGGTVRALEDGASQATFEQICVLARLYRVPGGVSFFFDALPPAMAAELKRAQWPFPRRERKEP